MGLTPEQARDALARFEAAYPKIAALRRMYSYQEKRMKPCPDCLKTPGKYHGFSAIEDCSTCKGTCHVPDVVDQVPDLMAMATQSNVSREHVPDDAMTLKAINESGTRLRLKDEVLDLAKFAIEQRRDPQDATLFIPAVRRKEFQGSSDVRWLGFNVIWSASCDQMFATLKDGGTLYPRPQGVKGSLTNWTEESAQIAADKYGIVMPGLVHVHGRDNPEVVVASVKGADGRVYVDTESQATDRVARFKAELRDRICARLSRDHASDIWALPSWEIVSPGNGERARIEIDCKGQTPAQGVIALLTRVFEEEREAITPEIRTIGGNLQQTMTRIRTIKPPDTQPVWAQFDPLFPQFSRYSSQRAVQRQLEEMALLLGLHRDELMADLQSKETVNRCVSDTRKMMQRVRDIDRLIGPASSDRRDAVEYSRGPNPCSEIPLDRTAIYPEPRPRRTMNQVMEQVVNGGRALSLEEMAAATHNQPGVSQKGP